MKFKYVGQRMGNVQLAVAGVIGFGEALQRGKVYDIPEDYPELIRGCELHPDFIKETNDNKKKAKKGENK